jgi:multidrug efflux pump subunit AcrB
MSLDKQITTIVKNPVFANLLMVVLLVSGFMAAKKMSREFFPQFSLDLITITVPHPGASQEEVEEGICTKLENALEGIDGISKTTSTAAEGVGSMLIEVDPDFDTTEVKEEIRSEIDRIDTFPEDAEEPQIKEIVNKDEVISMALYGNAPEKTLKEIAKEIKDELLAYPDISHVSLSGVRDYEITIEVSESTLRKYNITIQQIADAVRRESLDLPAGQLKTASEEITIRTKGLRYTGEEFRNIVVLAQPDGSMVRLYEIATISDGFVEDPNYALFNAKPSATIEVYKSPRQDIIRIANRVKAYLAEKNVTLPQGLELRVWWDRSKSVQDRLDILFNNGALGLVLVFLTLWFFLDFRLSFWVGMGIPISFAGALWIMDLTGQSINMISMFGLIMAIGMIVDDAIVIGENVYTYIKKGSSPWEAAIKGTSQVAMPVAASTLTTIAAFYPMFMVEGIMGKFIRVLPLAVIACLTASLIEAIFILPVHLRHTKITADNPSQPLWRRLPKLIRKKTDALTQFVIARIYGPVYRWALHNRILVFCAAISIFLLTLGLYKGGHVEFVLFPKMEEEVLISKVAFPYGTAVEQAKAAADRIETAAWRINDQFRHIEGRDVVLNTSSEIGGWTGRSRDVGSHLSQVMLRLTPSEERKTNSEVIKSAWRDAVGTIPGTESLLFDTPRHGPGGKPVDIVFMGRNFEQLEKVTDAFKAKLGTYPGVFDIEDSLRPGKKELRLSLRPEARTLGLTLTDLARQVRNGFYGAEALRIQRGDDDLKVMIRYPLQERKSLADLGGMRIRTPNGKEVPLERVANVELERGYAKILRQNGMRKVSITADLDETKNNAFKIITDLKADFLPGLIQNHPGISYTLEGQQKEREKSVGSLFRGFIFGLMVIFAILSVLFRSYFQPLIIMISIPFGVIGAILGHYILGDDLSLMSIFGIVGLTGIVVNDSLVLIDFVNKGLKSGQKLMEAVYNAGLARFRAVILTTVTTVAGLLPIILEESFQAQFLIPMAVSLSFGLAFATLITLLLVPSVYILLNDIKRASHWLIFGEYPAPEQVEPYALKDFVQ